MNNQVSVLFLVTVYNGYTANRAELILVQQAQVLRPIFGPFDLSFKQSLQVNLSVDLKPDFMV